MAQSASRNLAKVLRLKGTPCDTYINFLESYYVPVLDMYEICSPQRSRIVRGSAVLAVIAELQRAKRSSEASFGNEICNSSCRES